MTPELLVTNYSASLSFYVSILGFKTEYERPESKFAMLSFEGNNLMINERNGWWETGKLEYPLGRGVNFQIITKDVASILDRLKKAKYGLFENVEENWYRKNDKKIGQKEFLVQDPDGYLLRFAESLGKKSI